jgi:uncharacterized delta-60 repeat protein
MKVLLPIVLFFLITFEAVTVVFGIAIDHLFKPFVTDTNSTMIYAITLQPDGKYLIGGKFDVASGLIRPNLARFNADGTFDPSFKDESVVGITKTITLQPDGKILVGGSISATFNGTTRRGILRLNNDGSLDTSFFNGTGASTVKEIVYLPDGRIIIGGEFSSVNGVPKVGIARLNTDGSLDTSLNAVMNYNTVNAIAVLPGGKMMISGGFTIYNGTPVNNLIRIQNNGDLDTTFPISISSPPLVIKVQPDNKILLGLGGDFAYINDVPRKAVARLHSDGNLDMAFNFVDNHFYGGPYKLELQPDGKIIAGGSFDEIGGSGVRSLYRLNSNGSVDKTFPILENSIVYGLAVQSTGQIIVGGLRAGEDLGTRNLFFRLDSDGHQDLSFPASVGNIEGVGALEVSPNGKIYIGGDFLEVNGKERKRIARLNSNGTLDTTFNPGGANGRVVDLAVQTDGKVVIGGNFGLVNGVARRNIARLNADGSLDITFQVGEGADAVINDIAIQTDRKILIGGLIDHYDNVVRNKIARINPDGSLDTTFDIGSPGPNNGINHITPLADGKTLIGGSFKFIHGIVKGNIARLNSDGTLDSTFNPGGTGIGAPTNVVRFVDDIVVLPSGKIIIGGAFFTYNDIPQQSLALLNSDGTLAPNYSPSTYNVYTMILQPDGKLVIGGDITNVNNIPHHKIGRLFPDGNVDAGFNVGLGADYPVSTLALQPNGGIVIGGVFRKFDGQEHIGLARFGFGSKPVFDFDSDGKSDLSIFRPSAGEWWYLRSSDGGNAAAQFGASTDKITPGDFTGDGKTDIAFWRPSNGFWFVLRSEDFSYYSFPFGTSGDLPAVGDFDGDGKADATIFRPSTGTWYISKSSGGTLIQQFGQNGDAPVVSDYDGDGRDDIAIYRVALGEWWIQRSTAGLLAFQFGNSADKPTPGDFTGDGKADVALFRPSTGEWFVLRSEDQSYYSFPFGTNGDLPAPGDYDGDGKFDATVFRPSNSTWYVNRSTAGIMIEGFGIEGDKPVPNAFVP